MTRRNRRSPRRAVCGACRECVKGYAIAFMVELLAAGIAGAALATDVTPPIGDASGPQGVGQLFVALDVAALVSPAHVQARINALIETVRASGSGDEEILVPGEREARVAQEQRRRGIALPAEVEAAIVRTAAMLDLAPPTP